MLISLRSNKTEALAKSMNIYIWAIGTKSTIYKRFLYSD